MLPHIIPTSDDWRFARTLFRRYSAKEGSEHIASEVALTYLSACLRQFRPRIVVECGAGIGTITDALLSHECRVERVVATEHNEFCLNALVMNLGHHDSSRLTVITPDKLPSLQTTADMIVGDGSRGRHEVFHLAALGAIIFVEGNRAPLREQCERSLAARGFGVSLANYGAFDLPWPLEYLRMRLPARIRPRRSKGCWIGQVTVA